jgi:ABC-type Mn2+/Zn2+ transport system permease subunit
MTHSSTFILASGGISTEMLRAAAVAGAVGVAGAVLSVFVVLRKWAYLGDGISHAAFGGFGTALLISVAIPSLNNNYAATYLIATLFALATAMAIAWVSRGRAVSGDAAIGIFAAAALAWGVVAPGIRAHLTHGSSAGGNGWEIYLLGDMRQISQVSMFLGVGLSAAVVMTVLALHRPITLYCFDPVLAEVTGVPVGLIHYLLIMLIALVIVVGMGLIGNLLVPALLVLPGATGLAVSRDLRTVVATSIASSLLATLLGLAATRHWPFLQPGPAITIALFLEFLLARAVRRNAGANA